MFSSCSAYEDSDAAKIYVHSDQLVISWYSNVPSKCVPQYCAVHNLRYYNTLTLTLFDLIYDVLNKRGYRILTTNAAIEGRAQ